MTEVGEVAGRGGSLLSRLTHDARGGALIEFAILAGPLIAILLGIIQTSMIFFTQQALETAAEHAARRLMTGDAHKNGVSKQAFKADTCAAMPPVLKCGSLHVDVTTAASFSAAADTRQPLSYVDGAVGNSWRYNIGGAGSIVVARLYYELPAVLGPAGLNFATLPNGNRMLVATSVSKTEPFQ